MERYCDLHTHSNYSDGTCTPAELVTAAEQAGLSAVALCDHNTVLGLPEFLAAGQGSPVETVPGIEFSTDYLDVELHILGLFIRPEHYESIMVMTEEMQRRKERSNIELVEALRRAGYELDYGQIKAATPAGQVNRALIAAELTRLGYAASVQEAFATLLKPKHGYYHPPKRLDVFETISFIRAIGAVSVLAHPFLNLKTEDDLRTFLGPAVEAGLQGMETLYPRFDEAQTCGAKALAEEFGLLQSGGSDFHGDNKPDIRIGVGTGNLFVPHALLEEIRQKERFYV